MTSDPIAGGAAAEPVRVHGLTDQEGKKLQQTVRRGSTNSVRYRHALVLLTSADGNRVLATAQLVQADEDTIRDVPHFTERPPPASIEAHFGSLRQCAIANCNHLNRLNHHRAGPGPARLPASAQRQRPSPRRSGR